MKSIGLLVLALSGISVSTLGSIPNRAPDDYEVKKTIFHYAPFDTGKEEHYYTDIYYSQGYFEHPSTEFDSHLASLSLALSASTFTDFGPFDEDWYLNQAKFSKEFFENIDFNTFETNDDFKQTATFDTIGLCSAKKEYDNYTVVAVAPRSGGYFREWANNFFLGDGTKSDSMHEGWYNAAIKLIDYISSYVSKNNVTGRVKLWMSGFSRGGAVTNIAAALLDNKINNNEVIFPNGASLSRDDLYAYTFEAPQGANVNVKNIKKPKDSLYNNIFNVVNPLDVVPKLAMKQYGFTRFGKDKYVTNEFYDPNNYEKNRQTFNALLELNNISQTVRIPDAFGMFGFEVYNLGVDIIKTICNLTLDGQELVDALKNRKDKTKANYDANIASSIIIEELVSEFGDRNNFAKKYQKPFIDLLLLIQDENYRIPDAMIDIFKIIICAAISNTVLGEIDAIRNLMRNAWKDNEFTKRVYDVMNQIISPIESVYWERPNELLSLAAYASPMLQNHYPDIAIAHVFSQDSYYVDDYNKNYNTSYSVVPLIDNANYGRMKFFGYNDIGLRLDSKNGTRVINIEGHYVGKSDIHDCYKGYAAGYYSYITEEKMEVFMPINKKYNISMKSYSKKPYHRCEYWAYYEFYSLDNNGVVRKQLDHKKEKVCFNSDRHKRDVNIVF